MVLEHTQLCRGKHRRRNRKGQSVVELSFFLHETQDPVALLSGVGKFVPIPLGNAEVELVEGYSRPNKLVEIEITARR